MEIILSKHAGYCFGVAKAVQIVYDLIGSGKQIYTLGEIIHNSIVINELAQKGVKVIEENDYTDLKNIFQNSSVVIRAHGVSKAVYDELSGLYVEIVDATCPYVRKIHKLVSEKYDEGYKIVIAGDVNHPEVVGINGWCDNSALIIGEPDEVFFLEESCKNYCLVAQTTFNVNKWKIILNNFEKRFDKFLYFDTICNATVTRQEAALQVAEIVDLMIVIGDEKSSNTRKLVEICSSKCGKTFLIESFRDLSQIDFINIKRVGITAGASTPEIVIREVINIMSEDLNMNVQENFEEMLAESLTILTTGQTVKGNIIRVDDKGVFINLGVKYEGFVAIEEFAEQPALGDEVEAVVVRVNDKDGEIILSKKRIDSKKNVKVIEEAYENKTPVTVRVTDIVNGGIVGNCGGIRVFIPASQLASRFIADLSVYLKKDLEVRIVTFEMGEKNKLKVVGSHKVVSEENRAKIDSEFWSQIEVGKTYNGKVRSITSFGAFVDLGGIDGLVHLSELSWKKIKHPSEVVAVGDEIEVFVIKFDLETKKISLGYKKDDQNPWKDVEDKYFIGDILSVKVVKFLPFGAFVEIEPGLDGLVHISQISNVRLNKVQEALVMGQVVDAKIVEMNLDARKINLSIKEVEPIEPIIKKTEPQEFAEESEEVVEEVAETLDAEPVVDVEEAVEVVEEIETTEVVEESIEAAPEIAEAVEAEPVAEEEEVEAVAEEAVEE